MAAISYYVIGLLAYFIKGIPGLYSIVAPELAITAFVPVIVIAIWWSVRRIQKSHSEHNQDH